MKEIPNCVDTEKIKTDDLIFLPLGKPLANKKGVEVVNVGFCKKNNSIWVAI